MSHVLTLYTCGVLTARHVTNLSTRQSLAHRGSVLPIHSKARLCFHSNKLIQTLFWCGLHIIFEHSQSFLSLWHYYHHISWEILVLVHCVQASFFFNVDHCCWGNSILFEFIHNNISWGLVLFLTSTCEALYIVDPNMTPLRHSPESSPWDARFTSFFSSNVKNQKTKCLSIYPRHSSVWFLIIPVITCHFQTCFNSPCKSRSLPAVTNTPYLRFSAFYLSTSLSFIYNHQLHYIH